MNYLIDYDAKEDQKGKKLVLLLSWFQICFTRGIAINVETEIKNLLLKCIDPRG